MTIQHRANVPTRMAKYSQRPGTCPFPLVLAVCAAAWGAVKNLPTTCRHVVGRVTSDSPPAERRHDGSTKPRPGGAPWRPAPVSRADRPAERDRSAFVRRSAPDGFTIVYPA